MTLQDVDISQSNDINRWRESLTTKDNVIRQWETKILEQENVIKNLQDSVGKKKLSEILNSVRTNK